ncbi:MAG: apolipoprotein N-acyltransferase [Acidiferrobacterales bacterium]
MQSPFIKPPANHTEALAPANIISWLTRLPPRVLDAVSLMAGATMPLAFAPFNWLPLAIIMPTLLFAIWLLGSAARAAWRGFLFGLGMFGVGVSWVYVSLHNYGNMPVVLASFVVLLFVVALAAFPALAGWLQGRFTRRHDAVHLGVVVPGLWVLCEWLRGWILTGFPWLDLGYSQIDTPLMGFAPLLGIYGVSWAVAVSAGLLVCALRDPLDLWKRYLPALIVLWGAAWLASTVAWTRPVGTALQVALVQADVPLEIKWRPNYRRAILERYLDLSNSVRGVALIVWPEAAMPGYLDEIDPDYLALLRRRAQADGSDFLIGVIERDREQGAFYNSVVSIGTSPGIYRKQHLVPLGEFLPFKSILGWLLNYLQIPMSDFSRGAPDQPLMRAAGQRIGVSVCYEDAFGEEVIRQLPTATVLVNVSEDAWFGDSLAPHQRLQMARMRAVETGRPMLRAANTGLSAVIDANGKLVALSPQFQPFVLKHEVQPMQGATPYVRVGNVAVVSINALLLALTWGYAERFRGRSHMDKTPAS